MHEDVAIKVEHVSKDFLLPHEKVTSIKSLFTSFYKHRHKKTKDVQHALKDINLEIKKGEFFGIVGRNGSGKSTLLKILAGIYQPTKGKVQVDGKLVPFIELGVGFNPELTGRENVYLNGAMLGFSTKEVDAMYQEIVDFAELEKFMDQKLKNYSSGMQVRLAFSMAIRSEADILLIDEVLAVGDADFQRKCFNYFKSLKKSKKTVVFVSHDMNAVREYCNRAILIQDSAIVSAGKAEQVSQSYLRLFNQSDTEGAAHNVPTTNDENRWGNGWARVQDVTYQLSAQELVIKMTIKATRDLEDVVYGFRIRNLEGDELVGTNSALQCRKKLSAAKGSVIKISWKLPNIFGTGEYYIDPAVVIGDGATVCDWWNEAVKFSVTKETTTSYPVTPDIKFSLES